MAFGEVMMPMTEHSDEILAGAWPSQSVMSWSGYAMEFSQAANKLFKELDVQMDIKQILGPMEGALLMRRVGSRRGERRRCRTGLRRIAISRRRRTGRQMNSRAQSRISLRS